MVNDVAQCVLNALKLPETAGQTYDLGGPNVYSRLEIYEILHNIIGKPPKLAYFPYDAATKIARNFYNWDNFSLDHIVKDRLDLVCDSKNKSISDLYV